MIDGRVDNSMVFTVPFGARATRASAAELQRILMEARVSPAWELRAPARPERGPAVRLVRPGVLELRR